VTWSSWCATTSSKTFSATTEMLLVFLDANVLAKPVTRTLLMVGGLPSGFRAVWSLAGDQEAARHMRPRAMSPALVPERLGGQLTPYSTCRACRSVSAAGNRSGRA